MNTYVGTIAKIEGHYILTGRNENHNVCEETLGWGHSWTEGVNMESVSNLLVVYNYSQDGQS